jgi:sulfonate transport system ATP-binding protein
MDRFTMQPRRWGRCKSPADPSHHQGSIQGPGDSPGAPDRRRDADGCNDAKDDTKPIGAGMSQLPYLLVGEALHRSFGDRNVLRGVDVHVHAGEFVCLIGRSGAGKSVLLRILAGLDANFAGVAAVSAPLGVVFQDPRLLPWLRVGTNVTLGLSQTSVADTEAVLAEVGLPGRAQSWPRELSVGEAQRVALARTLIRRPEMLLLDEPFSALDAFTRVEMQDLLRDVVSRRGAAALFVTHDLDEALVLADRVLVLQQGEITHDVAVPEDPCDEELVQLHAYLLLQLISSTGDPSALARRRFQTAALLKRRRERRSVKPVAEPEV